MSRQDQINRLKTESFDILIVGGGATGCGAALEAVCRGLKVALVEREDFSSETSSRSTKLLHGGVRYLEQAVLQADFGQYHLVKEALRERQTLTEIAPHLSWRLPLITPLYRSWDVPYYTVGLKLYDRLSSSKSLGESHFLSRVRAIDRAPMLMRENLKGAVLYYDGQFNDSRMNLAIAMTALHRGAAMANYVEVKSLCKRYSKIRAVKAENKLTGEVFEISAKVVVNATGPFGDGLRRMDDPNCKKLLATSSGAHIVVDKKYSPRDVGILVPKTIDNRVLFILPWLGYTLIGTTDEAAKLEQNPRPKKREIDYILKEVERNLNMKIPKSDILSSWSGLRPLVGGVAMGTSKISRDHYVEKTSSGLISVLGGKWTTYRVMAEDVIDAAMESAELSVKHREDTANVKLVGADNFDSTIEVDLLEKWQLSAVSAKHLSHSYGDRAFQVMALAEEYGKQLLCEEHGILEVEIRYCVRHEMCLTPVDFLARRTRLAFFDLDSARKSISKTVEIMAEELGWAPEKKLESMALAEHYFSIPWQQSAHSTVDTTA